MKSTGAPQHKTPDERIVMNRNNHDTTLDELLSRTVWSTALKDFRKSDPPSPEVRVQLKKKENHLWH